MRPLILLFLFAACDAVEDDLPGKLVQVQVTAQADGCNLRRFTGDAGVQFFGERPDGGFLFTMAEQAQYGPLVDGGALPSVQRQVPTPAKVVVGDEPGCEGTFSAWERTVDGVRLIQQWPGADICPSGPVWLPLKACESTRLYSFTEVGTCQVRCVRIAPSSGEVECRC